MIPEDLLATCDICGIQKVGISNMITHLDVIHNMQVERWPDGAPVIDESDVPELM